MCSRLSQTCRQTAAPRPIRATSQPADTIRWTRSASWRPRLNLVHLKDVKGVGQRRQCAAGIGIAKIPEVEAESHRQNFRHLVAIEYEKEDDEDVRDDMRTNVAFAWKYGFSGA